MTPFYVGRVLMGHELENADPGTVVQVYGHPSWMDRIKMRNGRWYFTEFGNESALSDDVKYIIVQVNNPLDDLLSDPVEELAEELFRATHPYVSREVEFDDCVGSDEYRHIARLVFKHFDHKVKGSVKV